MQIFGTAVFRDRRVEIFGALQVTSGLLVQATVAREGAGDLANAVRAKVEADAGIVVSYSCGGTGVRARAFVGADERNGELVSYTFVIRLFHALHCVGVFAAFGF